MHISLSGGGSRALVYAAFFDELASTPAGQHVLKEVDSFSGVSAGAIVSAPLAMGVSASSILDILNQSQLSGWSYYPRMLAVALKLKRNMYSGDELMKPLMQLCGRRRLQVPFTAAVTTPQIRQECVSYTKMHSTKAVLDAAVASASVPFIFAPRPIGGLGLCMDGGLSGCNFPQETTMQAVRSGKPVMLFNSHPWPGFRQTLRKDRKELLLVQLSLLQEHALEPLEEHFGNDFAYQDGIFRHNNVTFIAPTGDQYRVSGGYAASGHIRFARNSKLALDMIQEGREIAQEYMLQFGKIKV